MTARLTAIVLLFNSASWWAHAAETTGEARALALQGNVVRISATLKAGSVQDGFGFIVGQQGNDIVIVTADHVVRGDEPGVEDKTPKITFFEDQGRQFSGVLQSVSRSRDHGDLAVILAPKPPGLSFLQEAPCLAPTTRGQPVWVVGRFGKWDVPVIPGVVAEVDSINSAIKVEGLSARAGSSGGPLISKDGIVGMIVVEADSSTNAISISQIQHAVVGEWHYPWQIPSCSSDGKIAPTSRTLNNVKKLLDGGDCGGAVDAAKDALGERKGKDRSDFAFLLGQAASCNHDFDKAARAYGDAYDSDPQGTYAAESLLRQANAYAQALRYESACVSLDKFHQRFSARQDLAEQARVSNRDAKCAP